MCCGGRCGDVRLYDYTQMIISLQLPSLVLVLHCLGIRQFSVELATIEKSNDSKEIWRKHVVIQELEGIGNNGCHCGEKINGYDECP